MVHFVCHGNPSIAETCGNDLHSSLERELRARALECEELDPVAKNGVDRVSWRDRGFFCCSHNPIIP